MATKKGKSKSKTEQKNKAIEKAAKGKKEAKKATGKGKEKETKTAYLKEFSNAQVESAAEEMNDVMELEPGLNPDSEDFLDMLEATVEQVMPSDEFTPPTMAVIRHLLEKIGMDADKVTKKEEGKKSSGKSKKSKKGSGKPKKVPIPHKDRYTRAHSIVDAFREKAGDKQSLIELADQIYQKKGGGECNLKESAFAYHRVVVVLDSLGIAKQEDSGNIVYSKNADGILG